MTFGSIDVYRFGLEGTFLLCGDSFQSSCCGVHDFEDWSKFSTVFPDSLGHQVPSSCCSGLDLDEDETLECQSRPSEQKFAKRLHGCFSALTISWQGQEGIVGYIAIAIVAIMVRNDQMPINSSKPDL